MDLIKNKIKQIDPRIEPKEASNFIQLIAFGVIPLLLFLFKMEILMPRRLEHLHQHCPHHNNSLTHRGPYLICK
jgi:hypothetical protein